MKNFVAQLYLKFEGALSTSKIHEIFDMTPFQPFQVSAVALLTSHEKSLLSEAIYQCDELLVAVNISPFMDSRNRL